MAAVTQYGRALRYVSDALKNDRQVVLAAVTHPKWHSTNLRLDLRLDDCLEAQGGRQATGER